MSWQKTTSLTKNRSPGFSLRRMKQSRSVQEETGTIGIRHPITYLVEASDDIVYATGDLEDGVRKGILHWGSLKRELKSRSAGSPLVDRVLREAERKVGFDRKNPHLLCEEVTQAFRTFCDRGDERRRLPTVL